MENPWRGLHPGLTVDVIDDGSSHTLLVAGEVDLGSSAYLRDALLDLSAGGGDVIVDLADVTFADSHLGHVLVDFQATQQRRGGRLRLVNIPPRVWRLLVLAKFVESLDADVLGSAGTHPLASLPTGERAGCTPSITR